MTELNDFADGLNPARTITTALDQAARAHTGVRGLATTGTDAAKALQTKLGGALATADRLQADDTSNPDGLRRQWDESNASAAAAATEHTTVINDVIQRVGTTLINTARPKEHSASAETLGRADVAALIDDIEALTAEVTTNPRSASTLWSTATAKAIVDTHDDATLAHLRTAAIDGQADRGNTAAIALQRLADAGTAMREFEFMARNVKRRYAPGFTPTYNDAA